MLVLEHLASSSNHHSRGIGVQPRGPAPTLSCTGLRHQPAALGQPIKGHSLAFTGGLAFLDTLSFVNRGSSAVGVKCDLGSVGIFGVEVPMNFRGTSRNRPAIVSIQQMALIEYYLIL